MCGISGIAHIDQRRAIDVATLNSMTDAMTHRGPDARGIWHDGHVGIGFRRLSIIDLSEAGNQPMSNEDESVWLVFNGEIYNFRELRERLRAKGHIFRSQTDSEVIVHGYEEWGDDVVDELDGMFAFAIWDARAERLLLARDRFGIKPLHYAINSDGLFFASEIKALMEVPGISRELSGQALWNYLTFAQVPAPDTMYNDIHKLLPGHILTWHNGQTAVRRYYRVSHEPSTASVDELKAELRTQLEAAVRSHLVADVPVGCFLSGGIDSCLIAALAARHVSGPLQTFSVTFSGQSRYDESEYQKLMADELGSEHHTIDAQLDLAEGIDDVIRATDEPFAIMSFLPLLVVSRLASKHVKVILSGDGSDELFAGYGSRYTMDTRRKRLAALSRWLPHLGPKERIWDNLDTYERLRRRGFMATVGEAERYISAYNWFRTPEKDVLLQPAFRSTLERTYGEHIEGLFNEPGLDNFEHKLWYEFHAPLHDEMLTKMDRAASAVSIEGRVPFLDRKLVELAWSIDPRHKWNNGNGKLILKDVARSIIPSAIIDRPKAGFNVPVSQWIREDKKLIRPVLLEKNDRFDEYVRPDAVSALLAAHDEGRGNHGQRLWALFVLKRWMLLNAS